MNCMSIGEVARKTGLGIETIRFYERKGLIQEPLRKDSGYRQYQAADVERLLFIQQAKTLGFTLTEILELLSLKVSPQATSREVKKIAQSRLADIETRIKMLKRMQRTLKKLVTQCPGHGPLHECPILESLDSVSRA